MILQKKRLFKGSLLFVAFLALCGPSHAEDAPAVSPTLKKMLGALPLAEAKEQLQGMVGDLKNALPMPPLPPRTSTSSCPSASISNR